MAKKNKSNAILTGPFNIPKKLVGHVEKYRKKNNLTKTAVHIEALELHEEKNSGK